MNGEEIKKFMNELMSSDKIIQGCKTFHEMEPRDIAYVLAREAVIKKPWDISCVLAGAKLIIITWNAVRYQRLSKIIKNALEKDIIDAYNKHKNDLLILEKERLVNLDFSKFEGKIRNIFSSFSSKKSIGFTGASKVLHILLPNLFMMWDERIRAVYHRVHLIKRHDTSDCYIEFLKQTQQIVKEILKNIGEEILWSKHLEFIDKGFVSTFLFQETILKMVDECNYMRIRKKQYFSFSCPL
ncbi:hypothetical protein ES705_21908 [subsurface metagenome]